jgi:penicillin amidase
MKLSSREMLKKLGAGTHIEALCTEAGIARREFDEWWRAEIARRTPSTEGVRRSAVEREVRIERDEWGIPHIYAEGDDDLFFGFGYAMAEDRLFQMDYLRRKGLGRLSEILGPAGLENDTVMRTIGINRIAASELKKLPPETQRLLEAFSGGVNALIEDSRGKLPIEFSLLDYEPEPWSPLSSLAIEGELRWYLTVRLPVIVIPELAKRTLGDGALYHAFLQGEADDESILPPGSYPAERVGSELVGAAIGDPDEGQGSNNWVIAGSRTTTGKPLLASDPHIAFAAVSCWYEVHLCGGSFNVAGMAYAGMPSVVIGRNERLAWGITNNICSQRDIYQEKTDPAHPDAFLFNGRWEKARLAVEEIKVRGAQPVRKTIRYSRNGPIIDEVLPEAARHTGPVSLCWLGSTYCGWLTAQLNHNRAKTIEEFRAALKPWRVPTFNMVIADVDGNIAYQSTGRLPIRSVPERGYRPGWDPKHQWDGLIPAEGMPKLDNPDRGWMATANNRPAPNDFPYPLSGVWSSGHRARRVRQMIESKHSLGASDMVEMHQDALSLRAVDCLPGLRAALSQAQDPGIKEAAEHLRSWDGRMETDRVGATIFEAFFVQWSRRVAAERFPAEAAEFASGAIAGLATRLLYENVAGWFKDPNGRVEAIMEALASALANLTSRLGPNMSKWAWGQLHRIHLQHVLGGIGDLGQLLNRGGLPVKGNGVTVCNTGYDPNYLAPMGANYRMIADLGTSPPELTAVDAQGQSGHPGSPHYCDQLKEWISGRYHRLPLDPAQAKKGARSVLILQPTRAGSV